MDINIEVTPKYIKAENEILNKIIEDTLKNKKLVYSTADLDIPKLKGSQFLFLERFIKKGIFYSFEKYSGVFIPIESFFISDNNIHFNLTNIFKEAILEENNLKVLELKYVLTFEESFTKYFYYTFIIGTEKEKNLIVPLEELRNLLNLKEYGRFYDFEINVLKKLKEDINTKSNFLLEYKKIKNGEFKNNKIVAIEFSIINKMSKIKIEKTNELMSIIAPYIKDFKGMYDMLYKTLNYVSFEELNSALAFIIKNHNKNFCVEEEIERYINNKFRLNHYKKIDSFYENIKNPLKFQNSIYKKLSKTVDSEIFKNNITSTNFLKKLYFAKEGEQLFFEGENIIISIRYSKKIESLVEIYIKK